MNQYGQYYCSKLYIIIMSDANNSNNDKSQRELAIRRAEFIKKLKIKVKSSAKTYDQDQLILIETFNTEKNNSVQLVMRRLSQLDSLIEYMNSEYGGHIIPTFSHDLYYQDSLEMGEIIPAIQEYLQDLKNNKYCRQDIKFYCFIIEQHTSFPRQMGLQRVISNATDVSRKYLNQVFTRKEVSKEKNTDVLLYAQKVLTDKIDQYYQIKQISLLKVKQTMLFEQITGLLTQMSAWPCIAIQPQEHDIDFISRVVLSSQKLIQQAKKAFARWEVLVDNVRDLQYNVYKGLHQYHPQLNQKTEQLKQWNQSLGRQFHDLCEYLDDKMEALSCEVYKINSKFIDMTVFAGQCIKIDGQQNLFTQNKIKKQIKEQQVINKQGKNIIKKQSKQQAQQQKLKQAPKLTSPSSFDLNQSIQLTSQIPKLSKQLSESEMSDPLSPTYKRNKQKQPKIVMFQLCSSQENIENIINRKMQIQSNQQFQQTSINHKQQITCDND